MRTENAVEELNTSTDRLRPGDRLWVEVDEDGIAENPFRQGHSEIHTLGSDVGDEWVYVKVVSVPGEIKVRVLDRVEDDSEEEFEFENHSRDEQVEWNGTEQNLSGTAGNKQNDIQSEGDVRGSKNDLLNGGI